MTSFCDGNLVSVMIMTSISVESASSANSACFPLMLFALNDPIRRLFLWAGGRSWVAFDESLLNLLDAWDTFLFKVALLFGLLVTRGSNLFVGDATLLKNTESSPGIPARGSNLLLTLRL